MNIQILVLGKVAQAPEDTVIVCGNSDYTLTFVFDNEWAEETSRVARFTYRKNGSVYYKDVAFTGDTVAVPVLSGIRMISVGVYAGELRTTTPAMIPCAPSILCVSATHDESDEMMWPSLEQRVAILEQANADWNQNDPTATGYVKNRTHYEDGENVKQLDEKYIPSSVARISDVKAMIGDIGTMLDEINGEVI